MLKNYLKVALRSLLRSKGHSLINILGLSLGIASCVLIALFVRDEWTFDTFHSRADRIYRVYGRENWGENQEFFYTSTPFPMGPALKENLPEVEGFVRVVKTGTQVRAGDQHFTETLTIAEANIFDVFDFELTKGRRDGVLGKPGNIVISDWAARKYFGDKDPIGGVISLQLGESFEEFTVTGVSKIPANSSIQFYLLVSDQNLRRLFNEQVLTSAWFNVNPETYVLFREGTDPRKVEEKFPSIFRTILGKENFTKSKYAPGLQPLTTIHLDNSYPPALSAVSDPKYSYILGAIAALILFVACINFVTLSVGRSLKRAREVGIRKVVGAEKRQLILQFIGEALLVTLISTVVGLIIAGLGIPLFNDLSGKKLAFPVDGFLVGVTAVLLAVIGLIAGSYPAFVLSAFKPIAILKGKIGVGNSQQAVRQALVGIQLVLSIFLISSTLVMRNQLNYLQSKNLGFDEEQLLVVQLNIARGGSMRERMAKGFTQAELFRPELLKLPGVSAACASSHDFANGSWVNVGYTDDAGTYRTFNLNVIDDHYIPTLRMEIVAGANFSEDNPSGKQRGVIINEAFAREMGWKDPLGKRIPGKAFPDHEVIGVVKDFNYASLYSKVEPLALVENQVIILDGIENINVGNPRIPKLIIRLAPGDLPVAVDEVRAVWDKFTNGEEFAFSFVDQALSAQYQSDQTLGKIVGIATLLAILIGSLGLYGLASLAMQNRMREVSIRKVLGATEESLLVLLSKDYVRLVAFSLVPAIPLTVYLMRQWLQTFEFRVEIGWEIFALAGALSLVIAMLAIGYQTIKTTRAQPADTLKYE